MTANVTATDGLCHVTLQPKNYNEEEYQQIIPSLYIYILVKYSLKREGEAG